MRIFNIIVVVMAIAVITVGCGSNNMIVLLPNPDGTSGEISVSNQAGSSEIKKAYQAVEIEDEKASPGVPQTISRDDIDKHFGKALALQPEPPVHFILYFQSDSTKLTAKSQSLIPEVMDEIKARKSESISVVGHTDTSGDESYNILLSTKRAEAVGKILIDQGVDPDFLETTSHGEENLLIKTGDNVQEQKNRRVEVVVR